MTRPVYGVVIRDIEGAYQAQMVSALGQAAVTRGVALRLFPGRALNAASLFEQQFNMAYRLAEQASLDGAILVGSTFSSQAKAGELDRMILQFADRMPTVSIGYSGLSEVTAVQSDNRHGMRALAEHLIDAHGCRRFAYIHGQARNTDEIERHDALREALAARGLVIAPEHEAWGEFIRTGGREAMRKLMPHVAEIDALVAANDEMAIGALETLMDAGVPVPARLKVVGFDDMFGSRQVRIPLTSVRQDLLGQAFAALDVLGGLQGGKVIEVPATLAVHASCGCGQHLLLEPPPPDLPHPAWLAQAEARLAAELDAPAECDAEFLEDFGDFARRCLSASLGSPLVYETLIHLASGPPSTTRTRRLVLATALLSQVENLQGDHGNFLQQVDAWTFGGLLQEAVIGQRAEDLRTALHRALQTIGIQTAFICVYAGVGSLAAGARRAVPARSRLLFAMVDGVDMPVGDTQFASADLLPPDFADLPQTSLVVQPLFSHRDHYGYCALERDSPWLVLLEEVREAISSVVCGRQIVSELERARDHLRQELDQAQRDRDTLDEEANRDMLTGLLNRRGLMRALLENSNGAAGALLMADLDGLKAINDTYGHVAGDSAITDFARSLEEAVGESGLCARLGGDEFVAALKVPDEAALAAMVARLAERVQTLNASGDRAWTLAYSQGSARLEGHGMEDVIEALRSADERLYQDKAEHKRTHQERRDERRLH
ncbi:GGDEF domain-containing protein [Niveibacterium sp. SC-1]|uniref:GGDEF domain-containing protein n=1 Tax=Niveibacterium sp. SC-1 TaxID=3135646 RepID=UPI00311E5826